MNKCKGCGRTLQKDEKEYCPACQSKRSSWWKKGLQAVFAVAAAAVYVAVKISRRSNDPGDFDDDDIT